MRSPTREGVVNGYYNDGGQSRGNCTYGVGIKVHKGPCSAQELQTPLSPVQMEAAFASAVRWAEAGIRRHVKNQALTQEQFDATVSFVFNVGVGRSLPTLQRLDQADFENAVRIMSSMTSARQKGKLVHMPGLVVRRREETEPFRISRGENP